VLSALKRSRAYKRLRSWYYWTFVEKSRIEALGRSLADNPIDRREEKEFVFYMAAAPGETAFVEDLVKSIRAYAKGDWAVVIQGDVLPREDIVFYESLGISIANNPVKFAWEGLFYTVRAALRRAHALYEAKYYIKLDPDALLINDIDVTILDELFSGPNVGLVGSYLYDCDGSPRDFSYMRAKFEKMGQTLQPVYDLAKERGYSGEGVQGGAYILARATVDAMAERGWLDKWNTVRVLRPWHMAEDHVFTMMTYACGFDVKCAGGPGQVIASAFPDFPDVSPLALKEEGRIFVHPLKDNPRRRSQDRRTPGPPGRRGGRRRCSSGW